MQTLTLEFKVNHLKYLYINLDVKKATNYNIKYINVIQNNLLWMKDELKLKYNEMKKSNEWDWKLFPYL